MESYLFKSDDVPYFPFKLIKHNEKWGISHPFEDKIYEINDSSYWILRLCDGYRTWYEITIELYKHLKLNYPETRKKAELFIREITSEGLIWWRERRMEWVKIPGPLAVLWDLTAQCNLKCKHCVVNSDSHKLKNIPLAKCKHLINQMHDAGVKQLILSGGEPLMRKDFFSIANYATRKGFKLQVATNATMIDESVAKKLANINASTQVSLDAFTPEIHDEFRNNKGSWARTIRGINLLRKENVNVITACVVTNLNIHEIPELYRLASSLRVNAFRIMPFVPYGRGNTSRDLEVDPSQMRDLTKELKSIYKDVGLELVPMEFECTLTEPPEIKPDPLHVQRIGCDGAVAYCTITADGEVLPCNYFYGVEADNVNDNDFGTIWMNSRILNYFRSLRTDDIKGFCQRCDYFNVCRGSCIAANFAHGDIFQSNCHCWLVNKK
ncbi:MAG: radical SAM protein [Bacteroidales bacterium]|nr:radical SAM protein [Bacteroidales bacterium]